MKYAWISFSLLSIWLSSAIIVVMRNDSRIEYIFGFALFSTIFLAIVGFRSPR